MFLKHLNWTRHKAETVCLFLGANDCLWDLVRNISRHSYPEGARPSGVVFCHGRSQGSLGFSKLSLIWLVVLPQC